MDPKIIPTVGRIVYYKTRGSTDGVYPLTVFAAIITEVKDSEKETVSLATFGETGIRFETNVEHNDQPGGWDWMPFQKDQQARLGYGGASAAMPTSFIPPAA